MVWACDERGEDALVGRVTVGYVEGNRGRGRPKRRWVDGVREALERRGITGDGRELVDDRMEWREVVYGRDGGGGL